jgi:hypothetical protein
MSKMKNIIIISLVIFSYIILFNVLSYISIPIDNQILTTENKSNKQNLGLIDSVGISVHRQRFFGEIVQDSDKTTLYILNVIPLPMKLFNIDFTWFHRMFFLVSILLLVFLTFKGKLYNKDYERRWEK